MCSDTKDNLLEEYVVIKGGLGLLTPAQRKIITGYQEHNVGFEGIIKKAALKDFPKSFVTENCNLDELVVRFNIGGKSCE